MTLLLAKNNGITLKDHSRGVSIRSKDIASGLLADNQLQTPVGIGSSYSTEDVIQSCFVAALLHDIGKAVPFFQKFVRTNGKDDVDEIDLVDAVSTDDDDMRYHNEFSWAFLCVYETELRSELAITSPTCWEAIKSAVFWHHAAAPDIGSINGLKIFNSPKFDMNAIRLFVNDLLDIDLPEKEVTDRNIPPYFAVNPTRYEDNALTMFVRSVVIRADREISGRVPSDNVIREPITDLSAPSTFDIERYANQMKIVDLADKPTTIIAAPAGFGKTIVGLAWALRFAQTVYWVCPRNAVIDSVYRGLTNLKSLFSIDINIEKLYTGVVQDKSLALGQNKPRIVVTNIDAFTTPFANNRQADLQFDMMEHPVVFDEFHEATMDNCPMYAVYNLLMSVRNDFTKSKSLLISATPNGLYNEIYFRNHVNYLPKKNGHYAPQHNVPYKVSVVSDFSKALKPGILHVYNVVKDAQESAKENPDAMCFHSKFTPEDKKANIDRLYAMYGKNATEDKVGVISGPIIRASMDVSFRHIELMVSSPDNDIQLIGRCCRWGEFDNAEIVFVIPDKLNNANKVYMNHNDFEKTRDIYNAWCAFLKANIKPVMTLAQIYEMREAFYCKFADLMMRYQAYQHNRGINQLVESCYPHRPVFAKKSIKNRGNVGSLRNPDPSISFVVKNADGTFVGPFQIGESYADYGKHYVKDAFRPYYKHDRTELLSLIESDPLFKNNFPKLYNYLTEKQGKGGKRKIEFYGTNPAKWRDPNYPFVVRPENMVYDKKLGLVELKDSDEVC